MLVDCGLMPAAQQAFHKLLHPNDYSWSSLIQGYVECSRFSEAFDVYMFMRRNSIYPGKYASVALLKACARLKCIDRGQELYAEIVKMGSDDDLYACNSLLDMYAKSGCLEEAEELFGMMPVHDIVSWNCLISGYLEHGLHEEALLCLEKIQSEDLDPTPVTYVCGLKASSCMKAVARGQEIHAEIIKDGQEQNTFLCSAVIDMYAKSGSLEDAKDVFDELPTRDVVAWTSLISGHVEHGNFDEAFRCVERMLSDNVQPNDVTYLCILRACSSTLLIEKGLEAHADIVEEGFENLPLVGSTLVDMYSKCGSLVEARDVFDSLICRDVFAWSALINGYTEHGLLEEAMLCVEEMQLEGLSLDPIMFLCILKACGSKGAADKGRETHLQVIQEGYEYDLFVGNTLLDMYGKCGLLEDAHEVFQEMPVRDAISWNSLMASYSQHGHSQQAQNLWEQMHLEGVPLNVVSWNTIIQDKAGQGQNEEVLKLYAQMQEQGLVPDSVTLVGLLAASGASVDIKSGRRVHAQTCKHGHIVTDVVVHTALIDMYAKCGSMNDAQQVFDELPIKDLVGWSALSMGYARQGQFDQFFSVLGKMVQEGIHPDEYALQSVLTTCSHAGQVSKGEALLEYISREVGLDLTDKHHNCVVDLLGRAGQIDEATMLLANMPDGPSLVTWSMVLGACRNWGNEELALSPLGEIAIAAEDGSAPFILLSNIVT
ncbi:hypothetical protein KP509_13G039400 [Ceratopteris richardii]|nr:hypothetical protein KP509_13G039400 [Ceratopteris richardii]